MKQVQKFNIKLFTIFPDLFPGVLGESLIGKALKDKLWNLNVINIRDYAEDKHKTVDDTPYGGGAGMVMIADVIAKAIDANINAIEKEKTKIIYMSPRGRTFSQKMVRELLDYENLAIICGRFEGIDQRFLDEYNVEEISIGDYVLTGGELPAMVMIDACVRCLPGVLGNDESIQEDSFGGLGGGEFDNLVEYDHYTKPAEWRGRKVPDVLLSGNHKKIKEWRLENAKYNTLKR
jgi:tRNA (guanine37-N1)-methyltransferase